GVRRSPQEIVGDLRRLYSVATEPEIPAVVEIIGATGRLPAFEKHRDLVSYYARGLMSEAAFHREVRDLVLATDSGFSNAQMQPR
ncbi:MAG: hypothetical protein OEP45_14950, partial [Acidobacteriota bacterium]|nr:hypothetical protein [Acidobacteriota bacterium]